MWYDGLIFAGLVIVHALAAAGITILIKDEYRDGLDFVIAVVLTCVFIWLSYAGWQWMGWVN